MARKSNSEPKTKFINRKSIKQIPRAYHRIKLFPRLGIKGINKPADIGNNVIIVSQG